MAVKIHNFKDSLKLGNKAEQDWMDLFLQKHPQYELFKTDGRSHDFIIMSAFGPFTLELKCDSYDMTKTENVFMERYSSYEKKTVGGPWQAQSKGVDLYCYYFAKQQVMLTANVNKLIIALEELKLNEKDLIPIFNQGYVTKGWKVKRSDLYEKGIITYCYLNDAHTGLR